MGFDYTGDGKIINNKNSRICEFPDSNYRKAQCCFNCKEKSNQLNNDKMTFCILHGVRDKTWVCNDFKWEVKK